MSNRNRSPKPRTRGSFYEAQIRIAGLRPENLRAARSLFVSLGPVVAHAQSEPVAVRFTVQPRTLVTTLVEVAVEQGFFQEEGIEPEMVTVANGPAAVTALASGAVDVATNAPEVFVALASKGHSLKLIAGGAKQLGMLIARPGFEFPKDFPDSVASLKGKKIGVTALSSATQYLTIMMLEKAGLGASDVEFVAVGPTPFQALANHVIDVAFVTGPDVVVSQSLGAKVMVDLHSPDKCPSQLDVCGIGQVGMWATGSWIESNTATVDKIRRAIAKADVFLHDPANAEKAREVILVQIPADSSDEMKKDYENYALPLLSAAFAPEDLARWIEVDTSAGVISNPLDVATVYAEGTPANEDMVRELASE